MSASNAQQFRDAIDTKIMQQYDPASEASPKPTSPSLFEESSDPAESWGFGDWLTIFWCATRSMKTYPS